MTASEAGPSSAPTLDPIASLRGAVVGVCVMIPLTAMRAIIDRNVDRFDESAWVPLFAVGLFGAYVLAGVVAARRASGAPLANGIVAALGALAMWIPLRVLIWAAREDSRDLFGGAHPVFTAGELFGSALFAAFFGLIGGLIGARMTRNASRSVPD